MLLQEGTVYGVRKDGFMMDSDEFQKACRSVGEVIGFENLNRELLQNYYVCHLKFQGKEYWIFLNCAYPVLAVSGGYFYEGDGYETVISQPRFIDVPELAEKFLQYRVLSVKELYEPLEYGKGKILRHKWINEIRRELLTPNMLNIDVEEYGDEDTLRHEWVYENKRELTPNMLNVDVEECGNKWLSEYKKGELVTPNMLNVDEREIVADYRFETFSDVIFNEIPEFDFPEYVPYLYLFRDKYTAYGAGVEKGIEKGQEELQRVYRLLRKDCSDEEIKREVGISEEKLLSYKKSFRELFD